MVQILMLGGGELEVGSEKKQESDRGSYIRVTEDSGASAVIHIASKCLLRSMMSMHYIHLFFNIN